jgi:hypothetical protein
MCISKSIPILGKSWALMNMHDKSEFSFLLADMTWSGIFDVVLTLQNKLRVERNVTSSWDVLTGCNGQRVDGR